MPTGKFYCWASPLPRLGSTESFTYQTEFKYKIFHNLGYFNIYSPLAAEKSGGTTDSVTTDQRYNEARCSGA